MKYAKRQLDRIDGAVELNLPQSPLAVGMFQDGDSAGKEKIIGFSSNSCTKPEEILLYAIPFFAGPSPMAICWGLELAEKEKS